MPRRRRPVGDGAQRMRCTANAAVAAACAGDGGRSACTASRSGKGSPRVRVLRERFLGYWRRGFNEYSVRRGRYGVVSALHRQQPLWAWWLRRAFIASTNTIRPSAARDCLHMFGGGCVRECVCVCVRALLLLCARACLETATTAIIAPLFVRKRGDCAALPTLILRHSQTRSVRVLCGTRDSRPKP